MQSHDPACSQQNKTKPPRWLQRLFGRWGGLHENVSGYRVGIDRLGLRDFVQGSSARLVQNETVDKPKLQA